MKTVANRMIVLAASALAFGTLAFGQNRVTAEIPFAFHTVSGTLAPGNYAFTARGNGSGKSVFVENTATGKTVATGAPIFDAWSHTAGQATVDFVCASGACSLQAIRTANGSLVYATPRRSRKDAALVSRISIVARSSDGE